MSEFLQRMKVEHKELDEKIKSLNQFIYSNEAFRDLDDLEQARMIKQSGFMESYASVLYARMWCSATTGKA